jgi:hypothetical protein
VITRRWIVGEKAIVADPREAGREDVLEELFRVRP